MRDEAREYVGEFFPKARVEVNLATFDKRIGVGARIIGDTAPHTPDEIVDCLSQLGVHQVILLGPKAPL